MKRILALILLITLTFAGVGCEKTVKRKGVSEEFARDTLEAVQLIDKYYNELNYDYYDIYEDDTKKIRNIKEENYIEENEEFSADEVGLLVEYLKLTSYYMLDEETVNDELQDNDAVINELIDKLELELTGLINDVESDSSE